MGGDRPKQYLSLGGRTILEHTLRRLAASSAVATVTPVVADDDPYWTEVATALADLDKITAPAPGGGERHESVANGLAALPADPDGNELVLVHDAVRPCVSEAEIAAVVQAAREHGAAILAVPVADTLKRVDEAGRIEATVDRRPLWGAQTPQVFARRVLEAAVAAARESGAGGTDESMLVEMAGYAVHVVTGRADNLKVTRPEDMDIASTVLEGMGCG
jgi:2-C-methyl-D-erythritol 4-phosphate cytidylyltransferase